MLIAVDVFAKWACEQHDVVCNQKYAKTLPYSFHLHAVHAQAKKWKYLLTLDAWYPVVCGVYGHDLIEDARVTYNDIREKVDYEVAEIIYLCTENKGRNRTARKNKEFYTELTTNHLAVFVKLCDIMANTLFSMVEGSSMLDKAKSEWPNIKEYLKDHGERYKPMFTYLDQIHSL